jgi:hypothetical protein
LSVEAPQFNRQSPTKIALKKCVICQKPTAIIIAIENKTYPCHDECLAKLAEQQPASFEVEQQ